MSAYSDWRCGAISEEEYKFLYNHELGEDHGELPFWDGMEGEDDGYREEHSEDSGRDC